VDGLNTARGPAGKLTELKDPKLVELRGACLASPLHGPEFPPNHALLALRSRASFIWAFYQSWLKGAVGQWWQNRPFPSHYETDSYKCTCL